MLITLLLVIQGGFVGYLAGLAFGTGIKFWIAVLVNAVLVVAYGILVSIENKG